MSLGLSLGLILGNASSAAALPAMPDVVVGAGNPLALWEPHGNTTRGTTPAPSGASPPAMTLTLGGSMATAAGAIRVECTTGGNDAAARFRYSFDAGATWIESNKALTAGAITCTGAMSGVTLNVTGTFANDNVWQDVVASVVDLGTGGNAMAPAIAAPYIRLGAGSRQCISNDIGASRALTCALNLPAPGTTPFWIITVLRARTLVGGARVYCGAGSASAMIYHNASGVGVRAYNGADAGTGTPLVDTWMRHAAYFSNAAGNAQRFGVGRSTGNAGNSDPANHFDLLGDAAGAFPLIGDMMMCGIWPGLPTNLDAIDAYLLAKYPGLAV